MRGLAFLDCNKNLDHSTLFSATKGLADEPKRTVLRAGRGSGEGIHTAARLNSAEMFESPAPSGKIDSSRNNPKK